MFSLMCCFTLSGIEFSPLQDRSISPRTVSFATQLSGMGKGKHHTFLQSHPHMTCYTPCLI